MKTRNCQECNLKLSGRKDQKFCSDYCRNTFNNRLNEDATNYVRRINNILRKNRRILSQLNPKGKMTVDTVFESLKEHFMDDSFEDVSRIGKYADILGTTADTQTPILIELKDYANTVPSTEVEKFWRDMDRRGTRYGIFISMRSGITKCSSCINLKTRMSKMAIFVVNSELNWSGHLFAVYVIKKLIELEAMKKKELKGEELSKIITKINNHVMELQKNVETINEMQTIADKLRTTCKNRLDELISLSNTYKRNTDEKITEILGEIKKVEI